MADKQAPRQTTAAAVRRRLVSKGRGALPLRATPAMIAAAAEAVAGWRRQPPNDAVRYGLIWEAMADAALMEDANG
jgi:hypothetical protein